MKLQDAAPIAGTRLRDDGYLVATATIARTGIQRYAGWEVGRPEQEFVDIYRPGDEVFSDASMASYAHRPITNEHPDEDVAAENWRDYAVGQTADEVSAEGKYVRVPLMVSDAAAIKDIQNGKRELSAGYRVELDWTPGRTPKGEAYDAVQRDIRVNHIAIVQAGRAGGARIGDSAADGGKDRTRWGAAPLSETCQDKENIMSDNLVSVVLGDNAVQVAVDASKTIEKFKADQVKALADAEAKHAKAIADKDKELGEKDAEIEKLKGQVVDDAALDKLVASRADVVAKAKGIAKDVKTDGVSDADIRRAAVASKLGDEKVKDKSDDYVSGLFDHLAADAKLADPVRTALGDAKAQDGPIDMSDEAITERLKRAGIKAKEG